MEQEPILIINPKLTIWTRLESNKICGETTWLKDKIIGFFNGIKSVILIICLLCYITFVGLAFYGIFKFREIFVVPPFWFVLIMTTIIAIIPMILDKILFFIEKKKFEKSTYKIYPEKIEYSFEDFFYKKQDEINLSDIKDIQIKQTFFQKKNNLGTICCELKTKTTIYLWDRGRQVPNYFYIRNIENPQFVYATIKNLQSSSD